MEQTYDAVVIGGGPGGYTCAAQLAKYGRKTALVERGLLGGTCLNRGCIPTKTFLHTASVLEEMEKCRAWGLSCGAASLDQAALLARKEEVTGQLRRGVAQLLDCAGVTRLEGTARVTAPGRVEVELNEGGALSLSAGDVVAAVGSKPALPPIPGCDLPGVVTSDQILEAFPVLSRLTVIGGGVIGVELASLYAALGTRVTILEGCPRILPGLDREIGQSLSMQLKKRGVQIAAGAVVERIERDAEGLRCTYREKNAEAAICSDAILVAVGRAPLAQALFSPAVPVAFDRGRVEVDGHMQSCVPHLYVIGDAAAGYPQLAHAASEQGLAAAAHIAGRPWSTDLHLVPSCVYTAPEIASVGLTEAEAKAAGRAVRVGKAVTSANGKSLLTGQERGFVKLVAGEDQVLLGAQLMCARATDMVGELALAIARGVTVGELAALVRPHPTFEEVIGEAARACLGKL